MINLVFLFVLASVGGCVPITIKLPNIMCCQDNCLDVCFSSFSVLDLFATLDALALSSFVPHTLSKFVWT